MIETILENTEFHEIFHHSIQNIRALLELALGKELDQNLRRLLYVNSISAMETYLSDGLIHTVFDNHSAFRRFIETTREFQEEKISLSQIFARMESIEDKAKDYLFSLVYHRLDKIKSIFKATLDVDFPEDMSKLFRAVRIRHDIVHRNGRTKDGQVISLSQEDVAEIIDEVVSFVEHIDAQLVENHRHPDIPF